MNVDIFCIFLFFTKHLFFVNTFSFLQYTWTLLGDNGYDAWIQVLHGSDLYKVPLPNTFILSSAPDPNYPDGLTLCKTSDPAP